MVTILEIPAPRRRKVRTIVEMGRWCRLSFVHGWSTCSLRLRRLVSSGVVRGFHADLDPAAVGRPIQAMIAVRLQPAARADIGSVAPRLAALPGVLNVFFLAGDDDFLIQVALPSPDALRAFVIDHLSASREFTSTETSLVFEHVRGSASTWDVRSV